MNNFTIEEFLKGSVPEIEQIIKIHKSELEHGFLSSLGDKVLISLIDFASNSKTGFVFTATNQENGKIVGFLLGTINTGRFYKEFILRKSIILFYHLIPELFSLKTIIKLIETLLYPTRKENIDCPPAELLDIAVLKKYQNKGIAKKLFFYFIDELKAQDQSTVKITTGSSLVSAHIFYKNIGAKKIDEIEVHKGESTYVYVFDF